MEYSLKEETLLKRGEQEFETISFLQRTNEGV
jgi:hypothetical protein